MGNIIEKQNIRLLVATPPLRSGVHGELVYQRRWLLASPWSRAREGDWTCGVTAFRLQMKKLSPRRSSCSELGEELDAALSDEFQTPFCSGAPWEDPSCPQCPWGREG